MHIENRYPHKKKKEKKSRSEMADAVVKNECIVSIDTDQPSY